jgi:hypothetical protein
MAPLVIRGSQKRTDPLPNGFLIVRVKQRHGIAHRIAPKHALVQHLPACKGAARDVPRQVKQLRLVACHGGVGG